MNGDYGVGELSQDAVDEIGMTDFMFVIAYDAQGNTRLLSAPSTTVYGQQERSCADPQTTVTVEIGVCNNNQLLSTCRWVNVGGVLRWICT